MKNISIRKVDEKELELLADLARDTFVSAFGPLNTKENMDQYVVKKFALGQVKSEFQNPGSEFYFACINKELVGYLKVNTGKAQTEQVNEGLEIERIYIRKEHQGKRVGQVLFDFAVGIARSKNLKKIWLGVWDQNEGAIRFYQRNGFRKFGSHNFYLGTDKQTDLLMEFMLTNSTPQK